MTDRELMRRTWEFFSRYILVNEMAQESLDAEAKTILEALRARLAQPEQEHSEQWWKHEVSNAWAQGYEKGRLQREWQGLTDEEIEKLVYDIRSQTTGVVATAYVARAIEAKLKEKNGTI